MPEYKTINNRVIQYPPPTAEESAFMARLIAALTDVTMTPAHMLSLVYGPDNPLLDRSGPLPMVTRATLDNPLNRVFVDMLSLKDIRVGRLDIERLHSAYTVDVPSAATQLGVTPQAIRAGIDAGKYDALFARGLWWFRPEAIDSLRLSRGGRIRKATDSERAAEKAVKIGAEAGRSLAVPANSTNTITE